MYAGTKIPLFVLKPMISLGTTNKFKKQSNNRFEYSSMYTYVGVREKKKMRGKLKMKREE